MTITIKDRTFTSNISLASILYKDTASEEWHMLMPDEVRESLKDDYQTYLELAEAGTKLPSKKQLRLMAFMDYLHKS